MVTKRCLVQGFEQENKRRGCCWCGQLGLTALLWALRCAVLCGIPLHCTFQHRSLASQCKHKRHSNSKQSRQSPTLNMASFMQASGARHTHRRRQRRRMLHIGCCGRCRAVARQILGCIGGLHQQQLIHKALQI